ncbi:MAG: hypothetical protein MJZ76_02995 [Bacteroidales bacterium]|nr:hypothetical protein [Bacteroidales bacterium]
MKKLILFLGFAALLCGFSSCKKDCVCTAKQGDKVIDAYTYENLTVSECEDKVDEATKRASELYTLEVGFSITCEH